MSVSGTGLTLAELPQSRGERTFTMSAQHRTLTLSGCSRRAAKSSSRPKVRGLTSVEMTSILAHQNSSCPGCRESEGCAGPAPIDGSASAHFDGHPHA
jgi:hypothetical protein